MSKIKQLNDSMSDVFSALVENNPKAKLPEELFVSNFLPFFLGVNKVERNEDFLPTWISVAGTPAADVDIIDKSGKVIFTVPSFIDSEFINPLKNTTGLSYSDIIAMSTLYGNNIPKQGADVLNKGLSDKINRLKDKSPNYASKIKMWETIFIRYQHLIPKTESQNDSNKNTVSKSTSNISDDDFE